MNKQKTQNSLKKLRDFYDPSILIPHLIIVQNVPMQRTVEETALVTVVNVVPLES